MLDVEKVEERYSWKLRSRVIFNNKFIFPRIGTYLT